ncbi:DUF3307 domain-containing protein [Flavobacteriaceae bacterium TK19130]|nr:DUF3307 domain-containing protein [Thermobacterium salinum]
MELFTLLVLQLLAHVLADYFLQTKKMARKKDKKGFRTMLLVWHAIIVFSLSWLLSFDWAFVTVGGIIAVTHYLVDGCKRFVLKSVLAPYAFFIDQAAHVIILVLVTWGFYHYIGWHPYWKPPFQTLAIVTAYLMCIKPANIVIREVLSATNIEVSSDNELPNAGKLIGILERLLTLTFILVSQYEAVGFLIAAKSILRYRDEETLKTEYVLIGTMLSFGIAVALGIMVTSI